MINQKIGEFICGQRGILNLGQIKDSPQILKILNNNGDLVKDLTDMIIQSGENSKYYNTIILNFDQLSESLTDKRFQLIQDKTYANYISRNFQMVGVNFREQDDIQAIIESKFDYNLELISFKVNYVLQERMVDENQEGECMAVEDEVKKQVDIIVQNILQCHQFFDDFVYIIDFNIINDSQYKLNETMVHQLEKKLYECTQLILSKEIPLENIVINMNLPLLGLKQSKRSLEVMEESAFNSLMLLSHSLPASIGGVSVCFDEQLDANEFGSYLNFIHRMKVITYFPITYMTHSANFEHLAAIWRGNDRQYMLACQHFFKCSESFEAGLNGNYKMKLDQLVIGSIEIGDFQS